MSEKPNEIEQAIYGGFAKLANAFLTDGMGPGEDREGNYVGCVTEALLSISEAVSIGLEDIADAIRDRSE